MSPSPSVYDLLGRFDEDFIDQLYRTLLGREPDPEGKPGHLAQLRNGYPKEWFIAHFAQSPEGVAQRVQIDGLEELCDRVKAANCWPANSRISRRIRATGVAGFDDVSASENRIGQRLVEAQSTLTQHLHDLHDSLGRLHQSTEQTAQLAALRAAEGAARQEQVLTEIAARVASVGQAVAPVGALLDRLTGAVTALEHRVGALEHQAVIAERRTDSLESTQITAAANVENALKQALERIEVRLGLNAAMGPTPDPNVRESSGSMSVLRELDAGALLRVRQLLRKESSAG